MRDFATMDNSILPLILFLLGACSLRFQLVAGTGTVTLRLVEYQNNGGTGRNGQCCDGRWILCGSPCDHIFYICLDRQSGTQDINSCKYGKKESGEITNQDNIRFGTSIAGLKNPMKFTLNTVPSNVKLKIDVWDVDDNNHDHVDYLASVVALTPTLTEKDAELIELKLTSRTIMFAEMKVFCDPDYYGKGCNIYCHAGIDDNFSCDLDTGAKVCHDGWVGPNCNVSGDDCLLVFCENNGTCVDQHLDYTCQCERGYSGRHCEMEIDECLSMPCANNGTCTDGLARYYCQCPNGWTGPTCQRSVNDCSDVPCHHNATCIDLHLGYICNCADGWTGDDCMVNINDCASNPCNGSGKCLDLVSGFECVCEPGWTGDLCEIQIDECQLDEVPCMHNSTCVDTEGSYQCNCLPGYEGKNCDVDINECSLGYCKNGAICLDFINEYKCQCMDGWTGPSCEINVDDCEINQCHENSTCIDDIASYTCLCPVGWTGMYCDKEKPPCNVNHCANNGSCFMNDLKNVEGGGFTCACTAQWTGDTCEIPMSIYLQMTTPRIPASNSMEVFLIGNVAMINKEQVEADLMKLLAHQLAMKETDLKIDIELSDIPNDQVELVHVLATASTENLEDKPKLENLNSTWLSIPYYAVKRDMTYPIYEGEIKQQAHSSDPENAPTINWAKTNWYVILTVILITLLLALMALIAAVIIKRMKKVKGGGSV